ncbi:hypothetical protein FPV67DRAFT_1722070 [Lyophyllum atratum]|nr:hypothetical protein FPV67DRAFT_1722070 [Lyophyllum atratum]
MDRSPLGSLVGTLFQGANTVESVISVIPADYRDCFKDPLREIQATTHRMFACRTLVAKWTALKQTGNLPPQFRSLKPTEVQFTKDFISDERAHAFLEGARLAHATYVQQSFDTALDVKKVELEHLRSLLAPKHMATCLLTPVKVRGAEIDERSLRPVYVTTDDGELILQGMEKNPLVQKEFKHLCEDLAVIALRTTNIIEAEENAKANKLKRKQDIKEAVDVEMGDDAPSNSKSIAQMVESAVAAALKKPSASSSKALPKNLKFKKPEKKFSLSKPGKKTKNPNLPIKPWTKKSDGRKSEKKTPAGKDKGKGKARA